MGGRRDGSPGRRACFLAAPDWGNIGRKRQPGQERSEGAGRESNGSQDGGRTSRSAAARSRRGARRACVVADSRRILHPNHPQGGRSASRTRKKRSTRVRQPPIIRHHLSPRSSIDLVHPTAAAYNPSAAARPPCQCGGFAKVGGPQMLNIRIGTWPRRKRLGRGRRACHNGGNAMAVPSGAKKGVLRRASAARRQPRLRTPEFAEAPVQPAGTTRTSFPGRDNRRRCSRPLLRGTTVATGRTAREWTTFVDRRQPDVLPGVNKRQAQAVKGVTEPRRPRSATNEAQRETVDRPLWLADEKDAWPAARAKARYSSVALSIPRHLPGFAEGVTALQAKVKGSRGDGERALSERRTCSRSRGAVSFPVVRSAAPRRAVSRRGAWEV